MDASRQQGERTEEEGEPDAAAAPGLGSLAEELLQRILALLPLSWPRQQQDGVEAAKAADEDEDDDDPSLAGEAPGLLTLRLVCRRWARSVLAPAVWRHRKLRFSYEKPPSAVGLPRLLRLAPELDELSAYAFCTYETEQMIVLGALANSPCKIRSLSVYSSALPAASALAVRTLELRRSTLQELYLELLPDDPNAAKYSYGPLLAAVDAMESLDKLALGAEDCYGPTVRFQFRRLSTVRRLRLYDGLHQSTIRSLLASNRDTLREVWCGQNEMAHLLAAEAPSVREVGALWKGSGKMLEPLRHLPNLDLLELRLMRFFAPWHERLARFLDSSPLVPRRVQLSLSKDQFFQWDSLAARMNRVTTVSVCIGSWPWEPREPPSRPLSLQFVEVLEVTLRDASADAWVAFKSRWSSATAPRLRELHLHDGSSYNSSGKDEAWVERLRAQRPELKLCTLPVKLCPAAIW